MGTINIDMYSFILLFILLMIPIIINYKYKLRLFGDIFNSILRMTIQLLFIGIFLKYLFVWNNMWINILWFIIMVFNAVFSVIKSTPLKLSKLIIPLFFAFFIPIFFIVIYLNYFVLNLKNIFEARYFIILSGMLLGNCLRGNIIALSSLYNKIREKEKNYFYLLSLGASTNEAILPYLQSAVKLALRPFIATMATMGIVALPGMMTGVILGGASPEIAIKYQIMIMIGILCAGFSGIILGIIFSQKVCFDPYGCLKKDVFSKKYSL